MADCNYSETWKSVPGFKHLEASTHGRVRMSARSEARAGQSKPVKYRQRILSQWKDPKGYMQMRYKGKTCRAHKMIALAFVGEKPGPLFQVNHKNGRKGDNRPENLEWVTPQENADHALASGLYPIGEKHRNARLTKDCVREIRKRHMDGEPKSRLAKEFGVCFSTLADVISRRSWRHVA